MCSEYATSVGPMYELVAVSVEVSACTMLVGSLWAPHIDNGVLVAEAVSKTSPYHRCNAGEFLWI